MTTIAPISYSVYPSAQTPLPMQPLQAQSLSAYRADATQIKYLSSDPIPKPTPEPYPNPEPDSGYGSLKTGLRVAGIFAGGAAIGGTVGHFVGRAMGYTGAAGAITGGVIGLLAPVAVLAYALSTWN